MKSFVIILATSWLSLVVTPVPMQKRATPMFISTGGTVEVNQGEDLVIECIVENLGRDQVAWRRQQLGSSTIVSVGKAIFVEKSKFSLGDTESGDWSLTVKNVMQEDQGVYLCSINRAKLQQKTTVDVRYAPTAAIEEDTVSVKEGRTLNIICDGDGNPAPTMFWTRKDGRAFPHGTRKSAEALFLEEQDEDDEESSVMLDGATEYQGEELTIENVGRDAKGVYVCTATSSFGSPSTDEVTVDVEFKPEVNMPEESIHTGEGVNIEILCVIESNPHAEVRWVRGPSTGDNPTEIKANNRISMEIEEKEGPVTTHVLVIKEITEEDIDAYTCIGENKHGKSEAVVQLSAEPDFIEFDEEGSAAFKDDTILLRWSTKSYSPIKNYKIKYRDNGPNSTLAEDEWLDVEIPGSSSKGAFHDSAYQLTDLAAKTPYQVMIYAENKYGKVSSDVYEFVTLEVGKEIPTPPPAIKSRTEDDSNGTDDTRRSRIFGILTIIILVAFF